MNVFRLLPDGVLWYWVFLARVMLSWWSIGDEVLSAACDVPPKQELRGSRSIAGPPQIRMSLHPVSSLLRPGIWGKRGSQAGFEWELILPRRQEKGRQRREQPLALSKGPDNILYLAASWRQLPRPPGVIARTSCACKDLRKQ